jgi:hypothetical protein
MTSIIKKMMETKIKEEVEEEIGLSWRGTSWHISQKNCLQLARSIFYPTLYPVDPCVDVAEWHKYL